MSKVSEEYPYIYHYTNEAGLYGILNDECFWATHFKFLNDYTEIVLFKDKLIEHLIPHTKKYLESPSFENDHDQKVISEGGGIEKVAKDEVTKIVDDKYKVLFNGLEAEIYITSFCAVNQKDEYLKNNGLLSQWRGYGGDGGYAIEFDSLEMENQLNSKHSNFRIGFVFGKLIYSDDEQGYRKELSTDLDEIAKYTTELYDAILQRKQEPPSAEQAFQSFLNCITCYKHQAFKEEKEVRIAAILLNLKDDEENGLEKERKFRQRDGKLIPYIELFRNSGNILPIKRIIVGPHKDKECRAEALRIVLRNKRRADIEVIVSDIPFI